MIKHQSVKKRAKNLINMELKTEIYSVVNRKKRKKRGGNSTTAENVNGISLQNRFDALSGDDCDSLMSADEVQMSRAETAKVPPIVTSSYLKNYRDTINSRSRLTLK